MGDAGVYRLSDTADTSSDSDSDAILMVEGTETDEHVFKVNPLKLEAVVTKNFSCQTDFSVNDGINIPVIFCGLFSPGSDAITQCYIPATLDVHVLGCRQSKENCKNVLDGKYENVPNITTNEDPYHVELFIDAEDSVTVVRSCDTGGLGPDRQGKEVPHEG